MKPVIWHVLFYPKKPAHFWARKYGHVGLAGWCDETWVHLELTRGRFDVQTYYRHDEVEDFLSQCLTYTDMLRMPDVGKPISHFGRPMTCTALVRHTLGIRERALLPDRLFGILRENYDAEWLNGFRQGQGNDGTKTGSD